MRHAPLSQGRLTGRPQAAGVTEFQSVGLAVVVGVGTAQVQRPFVIGGFEGETKDIQRAPAGRVDVTQGSVTLTTREMMRGIRGVHRTEAIGYFVAKSWEGVDGGWEDTDREKEEKGWKHKSL